MNPKPIRLKIVASLGIVLAVIVLAINYWFGGSSNDTIEHSGSDEVHELPAELTRDQYDSAKEMFQQVFPSTDATHEAVLMMAADRAVKDGQLSRAVACYRKVPTSDNRFGVAARLEEGVALLELDLAQQAENSFRQAIEAARVAQRIQPGQVVDAFKRLTYILSVEIRQEERQKVLLDQHALGFVDPLDSKQLFFPNLLILNSPAGKKRMAAFLEKDPENVQLQIADARYKTLAGNFDDALKLLKAIHQLHPEELTACAALAELYFEMGDNTRFDEFMQTCPNHTLGEPWLLTRMRGEHALETGRWEVATQFFRTVLADDPANAPAQMGLAKALQRLGNSEEHQQALARSSILAQMRVNLSSVQPDAVEACRELAAMCNQVGMEQAASVFDRHAHNIQQALNATIQEKTQPDKHDSDSPSP